MQDLDPTRAALAIAILIAHFPACVRQATAQDSLVSPPSAERASSQPAEPDPSFAIQAAIEALGSPSFAARRQAESWLSASEHEAYDALLAAKEHDNPEIRLAVRQLLDRQRILWVRPSDTPAIAEMLEHYSDLSAADRMVILQRIAKLDSLSDRVTLARLARYEPSEELSQRAALLLGTSLPPLIADPEISPQTPGSTIESAPHPNPPRWCQDLARELAGGDRLALTWLRTQLQWQSDPPRATELARKQADARWKQHLGTATMPRSQRALTLDLLRWSIQLADAAGDPQAWDGMPRFDDLLQEDSVAIREHLDWLASKNRWQEIIAWGERHSEQLNLHPEAALRVAEAWYRQGQPAHAETITQVALIAFPKGFEDLETLAHGLAHQGYAETASLLLAHAHTRTPNGSPERLRIAMDLAIWKQAAGLESDAAARLAQLLAEFEQVNDGSLLVTTTELNQARALQLGLLAQADARRAGHWRQLTGHDRQRYLERLEAAWKLDPEQSRWLELGTQASESWDHPTHSQWKRWHDEAILITGERIKECQHRLSSTPAPTVRFRLERSLKQQQLALAQLQLAHTATQNAGLKLLEELTADRQLAATAWERLAQARQDAGDLPGALVAARQAAQRTPRALAQVAAAEIAMQRQADNRELARESANPQR